MSLTTNAPLGTMTAPSSSSSVSDKGFMDFLGGILPTVATTVARPLGIDPRIAGQTVSQVMSIFGIGGPGKAFTPAVPKDQAVAQLKDLVSPHLADPAFATALSTWLQTALQPVQAQQQGKAFQPDLSKSWLSDAFDTVSGAVSDAVSSVDWEQVGKIGMQALPLVLAAL